jgi:hypothetical protein
MATSAAPHPGKKLSGSAPLVDISLQIVGKTFGRLGKPRVFGKMHGVDAVMIRQRQRPRSARLESDSLHIKAGQRAGSEQRIAQQTRLRCCGRLQTLRLA